jgi:hypothetical protein
MTNYRGFILKFGFAITHPCGERKMTAIALVRFLCDRFQANIRQTTDY